MSKITPNKPLLIFLYGFPGAGKTYFARQLCESLHSAHIQGDRIRGELFEKPQYDKQENAVVSQLMDYMAHEFLGAGLSVVYDTNAMRVIQRRALRDMARKAHAEPVLVWLQIDTESAFTRVSKRDRRRSDDKYASPVDRKTFDTVVSHMQNPQNVEDYIVISGKHSFKAQLNAVVNRLRELVLVGGDDTNTKVIKPGLVNLVPSQMAGRVDMSRRNIVIR